METFVTVIFRSVFNPIILILKLINQILDQYQKNPIRQFY